MPVTWRGGGATKPAVLPVPTRPSIAVLPLINMNGDPEQEYFADGLTDEIITTLSKISGLTVIARASSFTYKGKDVDVRQVGRELGVSHVLEGSVRNHGGRMRIAARLIDAETGTHVWAERYDRAFEDMFALQDEIALILVTELQVNLTEGEQARLRQSSIRNMEAWTHLGEGACALQPRGADARRHDDDADVLAARRGARPSGCRHPGDAWACSITSMRASATGMTGRRRWPRARPMSNARLPATRRVPTPGWCRACCC